MSKFNKNLTKTIIIFQWGAHALKEKMTEVERGTNEERRRIKERGGKKGKKKHEFIGI